MPLPTGGVAALPPSFVVNQLLDLMSRQRREVVPKCSTHQTEVSHSATQRLLKTQHQNRRICCSVRPVNR